MNCGQMLLTWSWNNSKLHECAKRIIFAPMFDDLAVGDTEDGHARRNDLFAGGRHAHKDPLLVPRKVKRSTTFSPSARRSSVVVTPSGKAERNIPCTILPPSRPGGMPGMPAWLTIFEATIASNAARLLVVCASR